MKGLNKKKLWYVTVLVLVAGLLAACGNKQAGDNSEQPISGAPQATQTEPGDETPGAGDNAASEQEQALAPFCKTAEAELAEASEEVKRSLTSLGNTARMRGVLGKLAMGEEITVAYIGGSITEGYTVKKSECYAAQVSSYLQKTYETGKLDSVNAGISGTPSTIGMLRLDQDVLSKEPDLVVIEFAVNDAQDNVSKMMYESMVKECLTSPVAPAVILLLTVTETGYTCAVHMTKIGQDYQLPVINVRSALWPEIEAGTITWDDYSKDEAHPSAAGHLRILEYFKYYFNSVLAAEPETEPDYTSFRSYGTPYTGMKLYNANNLNPESTGGFTAASPGIANFQTGWAWGKEEQGSFTFKMHGKNLFLLYKENNNQHMGTMEVYIDGKRTSSVYANAPDGYNNAEFAILLNSATEEEHMVEFRMAEDSQDKNFQIIGIGTTGTIESKEIIKEEDIPYQERAIISEGSVERLAAVLKRAEAKEKLTIGFIGGSITMGSGASNANNCYAKLVYDWWKNNYPDTEFVYLNAGIGATTSQFACARLEEDLLRYKPDFVIVEFSVNDEGSQSYSDSYESLLRRILTSETEPAVLVLNMVQYDSGQSVQAMHNSIAQHYQLPIISMRESIYKEIIFHRLTASDVSADNLHPNDRGHAYAAEIVTGFLDLVKAGTVTTSEKYVLPEPKNTLSWVNAVRYDNRNTEATMRGFAADTTKQNGITDVFKNGYKAKNVGDSIQFTVEGSEIALQYRKTNLLGAPKAVVIIDGKEETAVELDGNYVNGWGDWIYLHSVYTGTDSGPHTVEIRITEAGTRDFYLVSVISK